MQNYKRTEDICNISYSDIKPRYRENRYVQNPIPNKINNIKPKRAVKRINYIAIIAWCMIVFVAQYINFRNFINPVYTNRLNNKNFKPDIRTVYAPTINYISNANILGENVRVQIPNKKEKIIQIKSKGELTSLKNEILNILKNYKNLHTGIYIYDYETEKTVEINSDEVFASASIIKIPVLLDLFNRSKNLEHEGLKGIDLNKKLTFKEAHRTEGSGYLQYKSANTDYTLDYLAKIMIRSSDNSATNMLIEEVGGINAINSSLRHWGFQKTQISNWLPDLKGTNTTTPHEIATMIYNIDNQQFVTLKSSAIIKEYMSKVENRTLIKSQIPDNAIIMHKTGDIGTMLGDAAAIYTPSGKKFILTIMVKRPHNDYSARDLIQKVSKTVYNSLAN